MVNSIYCSNEKIQVVVGSPNKNNINISNCKEIVLPEGTLLNGVILDADTLKNKLIDELQGTGIQGKELKLVIDSTSILTKMIRVPNLSAKIVYNIIKMEFEPARNREEFVYDYHVINSKNPEGGATIFACAVAKSFVESYKEIFNSAGFKVNSIDIIQSAVIKLVENFELFKNETCTLIINDGNSIVLNLFVNGMYMLSTRYRLVETLGTSESVNEILGRISVHTQFIATQKLEYKISKIYFCGDYGEEIDITTSLKNVLDINSEKLDLGSKMSFFKDLHVYNYIYSIGNMINTKNKSINLEKQIAINYEKKQAQKKKNLLMLPIAILLILILGVYLAFLIPKTYLENKTDTLNQYISDSQTQEDYNKYLVYSKENSNYLKILNELEKQDEMLTYFPDLSSDFFTKINASASGLITTSQLTYGVNAEDNTVTLELIGVAPTVSNIVEFIGNLEENGIKYRNNGYNLSGTIYEFSVICELEAVINQK